MVSVEIILSWFRVFVSFCIFVFAFIWAILGFKAYFNWYRDEYSDLYLYEVSVQTLSGSYECRYFANSQSMALRKFQTEYDLDKKTKISVRLISDKKHSR